MLGVNNIGKSILISNGIYTEEDLIKLIKFNKDLLITKFRNDEGSVPSIFRIDLMNKTRTLIEEALKNGIKDPEVFNTARVLGFERLAF